MAKKKKKHGPSGDIAAQNRKARHDYFIEETFEAGIMLMGSEVKALRRGSGSIGEAYAAEKEEALFLINAYIPEYASAAARTGHEPKRPRKLLMHKREIARLLMAIAREGYTLVPLSIYFNARGIAKVELGLGKGKHQADKRQSDKDRSWKRNKARLMSHTH